MLIWLMWECLGRKILEKTNPGNFQFHISVGTLVRVAFGEPPACRRYSMSTAGVHRLCWDARILLVLHFMVNAILFVQNMQVFTVAVQYDAFSFQGVDMHTDSAFDRSTLVEMHRLKNYRYASTVVQNVCANLLRTRSSKQTVS